MLAASVLTDRYTYVPYLNLVADLSTLLDPFGRVLLGH